jgi:hypothetical protein
MRAMTTRQVRLRGLERNRRFLSFLSAERKAPFQMPHPDARGSLGLLL